MEVQVIYNLKFFLAVAMCFLLDCSFADKYSDFINHYNKNPNEFHSAEFTDALKETLGNLDVTNQKTISSFGNCFGLDEEVADRTPLYIFRLEKLKKILEEKEYSLDDTKLEENFESACEKYITVKNTVDSYDDESKVSETEESFEWGD